LAEAPKHSFEDDLNGLVHRLDPLSAFNFNYVIPELGRP
jgi:hypothetical protein